MRDSAVDDKATASTEPDFHPVRDLIDNVRSNREERRLARQERREQAYLERHQRSDGGAGTGDNNDRSQPPASVADRPPLASPSGLSSGYLGARNQLAEYPQPPVPRYYNAPPAVRRFSAYESAVPKPPEPMNMSAEDQGHAERRGLSNTITVRELNGIVAELPGEKTNTVDERLEHYICAQGAQLTDLDLSGTQISERGLGSLNKAPHLSRLLLAESDVSNDGLKALGQQNLSNLHELSLAGTKVGDSGIVQLRNLPLTVLNLGDTATTDGCMPYLKDMQSLQVLDANYTGIGDRGVKSLADMPNLRSVSLKGCPITDDCVKDLARCQSLMLIDLRDTRLSAESVEWLQAHMPRCVIMVPDGQLSAQALRTTQSHQQAHRHELIPRR